MRLRLLGLATMLAGALVFGGASSSMAGTPPQQDDAGCVLPDTIDKAVLDQFSAELDDLGVDPGTIESALASLAGVPCPTPGGGARLEGDCVGIIVSVDPNGEVIDLAVDADPDGAPIDALASLDAGDAVRAFTKSNPFRVDVDGSVVYVGRAGEAGDGPKDNTWNVSAFGIDLERGHGDNAEGLNSKAGVLDLGADLPAPAKMNALFQVSGRLDSVNGISCVGAGYIETTGGLPLADGVGVVALVGAGLGALFTARPTRIARR